MLAASLGCLALVIAALATQASASTITVTNLNDSGPGSLRQAIAAAASGETVSVPAGQITLTSGPLAFSKNLTIIGAGAGVTVISANNASRALTITGTPTVTLDGLTITQGKETFGAGINAAGTLTLDGVVVSGNHAGGGGGAGFGGGIFFFGPGTLSLIDSGVDGNTAGGGSGGSGFGGGIDFSPSENGQVLSLSLAHSSVSENQAGIGATGFGGGIEASTGYEGGSISLDLVESAVSDNVAGGSGLGDGFGGGIDLGSGGSKNTLALTLDRAAVTGNTAGGGGGKSSGFGGGILYGSGGSGVTETFAVTNSTIASNSAGGAGSEGFGGGIDFGPGTATLSYVTVADNSAGGGGAKAFGGGLLSETATSTADSSVFAANSGGNCLPALTSAGHNIDDGTSCGFTGAGDKQGVEAKLGALGAYGGPTPTLIPLSGSPAIDAGDRATCPPSDQRGMARPQGSACDSGAFEVAPPAATTGSASAIAATSATLNGLAGNPELTGASVFFQYGTTIAYGSQTTSQALGAATIGAPFSAGISGLLAGTLYHYRSVVVSAAGTAFGADGTFTTVLPPPPVLLAVTSETLSPTAFPAAPSGPSALAARRRFGTKVSYTLSEAASVRFTVLQSQPGRKARGGRCVKATRANRRARRCTRLVTLTSGVTRSASAGANFFRFTGRLSGRKLAPGQYRLLATPVAGGKTGRAASAAFRVIK